MNKELAEDFLKQWHEGRETFYLKTSGSTGEPKTISLEKQWMKWSAAHTAEFLKPAPQDKILCCLPLNRIGGLMMLVRAMEWEIPFEVTEPVSNPLLDPGDASIISLTPFQLHQVMQNPSSLAHLSRFREVLIGGGEVSVPLRKAILDLDTNTVFRHSYGMTETYSHIALRSLNGPESSDWFTPFSDVNISCDPESCAVIKTPFYPEGLVTQDIIELHEKGKFRVLGRRDFTINSGGVKLQAERIEKMIQENIPASTRFIISSIKDIALGEKLVLVTEDKGVFEGLALDFLKTISPYAIPKEILEINPLPVNEGGKTDRLMIKKKINS
jgi:O-succinylbenzoic acid--CoA ligase